MKLCDFGEEYLKTMRSIVATSTKTLNTQGHTMTFLVPEVAVQSEKISINSDVYSLDMTIFNLLLALPIPWSNEIPVPEDVPILDALKNKNKTIVFCTS